MTPKKEWGQWTLIKLNTLEGYYSAFTRASTSAPATLYLDLFGGAPENKVKDSERLFAGSTVRAAQAKPPFSKILVAEMVPSSVSALRETLAADVASGRVEVLQGDCNSVIPAAMLRLPPGFRKAPTFALIDQFSAEITWDTLKFLADFKDPHVRSKIEMCLYFGESFVPRGLHGPAGRVNAGYAARVDAMFGDREWRQILAAREDGVLGGAEAQWELLNLMRWKLENQLGYRRTFILRLSNTTGTGLFSMIFVTDNETGEKIMRHQFAGAGEQLAEMVQEGKRLRRERDLTSKGIDTLFSELDAGGVIEESPRSAAFFDLPTEPFMYHRLWDRDRT